ncbi:MAG: hypothetical protein LAP61_12620 [Acidobacteriia bacterium]|nr:hypothetical protein [Terriglobia bacterium]
MQHAPDPAQRLAGFKPPIVGIGIEIRQTVHYRESARELRLPGAWGLALPPKRGVRVRATFRDIELEAPPVASLLLISRGAEAILTRIENWVTQHSGEPGWNVRPRLIPPTSGSSAPLLMRPFSRPAIAREHSNTIKSGRDTRVSHFFPNVTLGILPEFPVLDLKPEKVVEPDYALPRSDAGASTREIPNWVHYRELALPPDHWSQMPSLQATGHVSLSPDFAETETHVSESGLTAMASRAKPHAKGILPAILIPGPTSPPLPVTPSMIGPKPMASDASTPSLLDGPANPHIFAASQPFADAAIPEAQTNAALPGPRVWFAVRVPSPYVLETPTPVDMSKRLHYVHGARHICTTAIPAEVVWYPAGLPAGEKRILHVAPDLLSDSVFRKSARSLTGNSVPEISEPLPPIASPVEQTLPPIDQSPAAFMPRDILSNDVSNVEAFPMEPAIVWAGALNEIVPKERGPVTREIHPIPDSPDFFPFRHRAQTDPGWAFQLAVSTGASFAISVARTCEPETALVAIPDITHRPWRKTAETSRIGQLPQPVRLAPALASFRTIARPESMQSSFAEDLRDRIFKPILPARPRTHLRPPGMEIAGSTLRESHTFEPLDFRWQRNRKVRDRGAPWMTPSGIGSLPGCEIPQWPGPLSDAWWGDPESRPN